MKTGRQSFFLPLLTLALSSDAGHAAMFDTGGGHAAAGLSGAAIMIVVQLGLVLADRELFRSPSYSWRSLKLTFIPILWLAQILFVLAVFPVCRFFVQEIAWGFLAACMVLWVGLRLPSSPLKLYGSLAISTAAWLVSIGFTVWLARKIGIGEPNSGRHDIEYWRFWIALVTFHGLALGYYGNRALTFTLPTSASGA